MPPGPGPLRVAEKLDGHDDGARASLPRFRFRLPSGSCPTVHVPLYTNLNRPGVTGVTIMYNLVDW